MMRPLAVFPSPLVVRPHKGMSINKLSWDIELDRIALANERARKKAKEWNSLLLL